MPQTDENPDNRSQETHSRANGGADGSASMTQELWAELQRAQQLASQVSDWGSGFVALAWLELRQALACIPRMMGLGLALIPLAGLTWITLSMLLAWLSYVASDIPTVGFAVLFALQLLVSLLCVWRLKRLRKQASMPETREQLQLFLQEIQQMGKAEPREDSPGNPR